MEAQRYLDFQNEEPRRVDYDLRAIPVNNIVREEHELDEIVIEDTLDSFNDNTNNNEQPAHKL